MTWDPSFHNGEGVRAIHTDKYWKKGGLDGDGEVKRHTSFSGFGGGLALEVWRITQFWKHRIWGPIEIPRDISGRKQDSQVWKL